jgi:hypothetical protein
VPDTDARLVAARLGRQWLTDRPGRSPGEVVRHLLAVQAQDGRGARLAVRPRSTGLVASDVDAAFDRGELIVSWLNRGTLHLVAAEDYWWLHPLTTPQLRTTNARRLVMEGVTPDVLPGALDVIMAAVAGGPKTRAELRTVLDGAGIVTAGQALVHLLLAATLEGLVVRGPMSGPDQAFVSVEAWLGPPARPVERAEGLARLASRYLAGHAPAEAPDLANWAGISLREARQALADGADGADVASVAAVAAGAVAAAAGDHRGHPDPRLLGPFDPLLHGWKSRDPFVGAHKSVVTTNGIFRPVALVGGRAVGIWGLRAGSITIQPFEPISDEDAGHLVEDAADVRRYLGVAPGKTHFAAGS